MVLMLYFNVLPCMLVANVLVLLTKRHIKWILFLKNKVEVKDIGLVVDNYLTFSNHIVEKANKAKNFHIYGQAQL